MAQYGAIKWNIGMHLSAPWFRLFIVNIVIGPVRSPDVLLIEFGDFFREVDFEATNKYRDVAEARGRLVFTTACGVRVASMTPSVCKQRHSYLGPRLGETCKKKCGVVESMVGWGLVADRLRIGCELVVDWLIQYEFDDLC